MNDHRRETRSSEARTERGLLVGAGLEDYSQDPALHGLDELAELARTAGVEVVARYYQRRAKPESALFVGRGKVEEIASGVREHEADVVLFDSDLTPRQVRNLEERLGCKVLDRSEVILDIFATHARTLEARLQVELAQLRYTRPRLKRMWTHLSRIVGQGGIGSRGPGEKQIETDRRLIDRRITALEREIETIKARRERQVATRRDALTVSLIGYTNAGKSTLMNRLTQAGVEEADRLFATLSTKTSDFLLPNGKRVLLSDTVGFIKDLPHHLVASFHATLEEVRQARLLLHVVDATNPDALRHVETVEDVLVRQLGIEDAEEILVLNKCDAGVDRRLLQELDRRAERTVIVSALTGQGIDGLVAAITAFDDRQRRVLELEVPAADGRTQAELSRRGEILARRFVGDRVRLRVSLPPEACPAFEKLSVDPREE